MTQKNQYVYTEQAEYLRPSMFDVMSTCTGAGGAAAVSQRLGNGDRIIATSGAAVGLTSSSRRRSLRRLARSGRAVIAGDVITGESGSTCALAIFAVLQLSGVRLAGAQQRNAPPGSRRIKAGA